MDHGAQGKNHRRFDEYSKELKMSMIEFKKNKCGEIGRDGNAEIVLLEAHKNDVAVASGCECAPADGGGVYV